MTCAGIPPIKQLGDLNFFVTHAWYATIESDAISVSFRT